MNSIEKEFSPTQYTNARSSRKRALLHDLRVRGGRARRLGPTAERGARRRRRVRARWEARSDGVRAVPEATSRPCSLAIASRWPVGTFLFLQARMATPAFPEPCRPNDALMVPVLQTMPPASAETEECENPRRDPTGGLPSQPAPRRPSAKMETTGPCALAGSFRRGYAQCQQQPVYKPPSEHGPQCAQPMERKRGVHTPVRTRSAVYTVGPCALAGPFRRRFAHCRNGDDRAVRTGRVVPTGLCAVPAATSVQTPAGTRSAVYKADGNESAVCIPPSERGTQRTHPDRAHWQGRSEGAVRTAGM